MEFLDLIESISENDASGTRLYGGEGRRARGIRSAPNYPTMLKEGIDLVAKVAQGSRHAALVFEEAMSTSDFPLIFGDILDRQLLAAYREYPSSIEAIAKVSTLRDFRQAKRFAIDGADGQLDAVAELGEYPASAVTESKDTLTVTKFGRRLPFSWEDFINDDLDAFRDAPARLGRATRRTEQKALTQLYVDANGPHASLYTTGNKNKVVTGNGAASSNPVLSVAGLQSAMTVLGNQVDAGGEPIYIEAVTLVVPPALEVTANNILNGTELWLTEAGGTSNQQLHVANWMRNRVKLVVDPYIPLVATSANGATSWFLFANPSVTDRAALEFARLRGHEEPEIWVKSPNAMRAGGGMVGPDQGDFDDDSIQYRVRAVFGGARLTSTGGGKLTAASNGSGS